jgi:hypothetical protein
MSWLDQIENSVFTITTGDGKVYKPLWKSGETEKGFNASVFEFINQDGAFVDRRRVKARKFPLLFWFQGANNVAVADAFDRSANDSRAWRVDHPFYGTIYGQPISLNRNDNDLNVTEVTVEFWETIKSKFPVRQVSVTDEIASKVVKYNTLAPMVYATKVDLKPADVNVVRSNAQKINAIITDALDAVNYSEYQQYKNDMFTKVDDLLTSPSDAIKSINEVVAIPANFNISVNQRLNLLQAIFNSALDVIKRPLRNNKSYFETMAGASILAIANAVVNPLANDYVTRNHVLTVAVQLQQVYNTYVATLDNLYISINDTTDGFTASSDTQSLIKATVVETLANLNTLAFNAKQERITILEKDSNIILLAHKYVGLDADDVNLNQFREINNIKNRSLFILRKGRQIKYYV